MYKNLVVIIHNLILLMKIVGMIIFIKTFINKLFKMIKLKLSK